MKKALKISLGVLVALYFGWAILDATVGTETAEEKRVAKQSKLEAMTAKQMKKEITPDALYNAINKVRVKNNLTPFSRNPDLDKSAKLKCKDMVKHDYYEHDNPKTGKAGNEYITDVLKHHGYTSENLNAGVFLGAKDAVKSWMESEAHRASIIDPKYTEIGFATCIIPKWPDELVIVQHKIEPREQQQVQNNYYQQPSYRRPSSTTCNSYQSLYSDNVTTHCRSY